MITRVSFFVCLLCVALVNAKSNRIVDGENADPDQFKYQTLLEDEQRTMCGAAIIADQYVLTAAHCVVDDRGIFYLSKYYVVAGSTNVHTDQDVRIDVEKIFVPNTYNPMDKRNDIAVLKLRRGFDLDSNPNLEKINLPPNRELSFVGHSAVMSGYGDNYIKVRKDTITRELEVNGHTDGKLRYAMTNVISNEECLRKITKYEVDENQICAQAVQYYRKRIGICKGDSGGPLVSDNIIIGVASLGTASCWEARIPAIYTRVSSFIGFITNAMKDVKTSDIIVRQISSGESSSRSKRTENLCRGSG